MVHIGKNTVYLCLCFLSFLHILIVIYVFKIEKVDENFPYFSRGANYSLMRASLTSTILLVKNYFSGVHVCLILGWCTNS